LVAWSLAVERSREELLAQSQEVLREQQPVRALELWQEQ
jgi:hypothetical protein